MARICHMYAASYVSTMMLRIKKEEPDFFDDKDYTEEEMGAKIEKNLCLDADQYRSKQF